MKVLEKGFFFFKQKTAYEMEKFSLRLRVAQQERLGARRTGIVKGMTAVRQLHYVRKGWGGICRGGAFYRARWCVSHRGVRQRHFLRQPPSRYFLVLPE